jgi:hypothetical protein
MPGCTADTDDCEHSDNVARDGSAGSSLYPAAGKPAEFTAAAVTISVGVGCGGAGGGALVVTVALGRLAGAVLDGAAVAFGDVVARGLSPGTVCQGCQTRTAAATAATMPIARRAFACAVGRVLGGALGTELVEDSLKVFGASTGRT